MKNLSNINKKLKRFSSSWFVRIFAVVAMTVLLCYSVTMLAFAKLGSDAYTGIKINEMIKKTQYIADISSDYLEMNMTNDTFRYMLADGNAIWDATVYIYNQYGIQVMHTIDDTRQDRALAEKYIGHVLRGHVVKDMNGIVIGYPVISSYGNVIGAVFMVKSISEFATATALVKRALLTSSIIAFGIMMIPIIVISARLVLPIRNMQIAAEEMEKGNFDYHADAKGNSEIARLGRSLNHLSKSLKSTIGSLKTQSDRLQTILDGISDGVIAFDSKGKMVQCNPAAEKLLKSNDIDSEIKASFDEKLNSLQESNEQKCEFDLKKGERVLHFTLNKVIDRSNDSITVIALIYDITEAARYEQSRKDYVANVSHELRTPIATIKGIAEAFNDEIIDKDEQKKYYQYLYKESDRLARLINDLLELSRLQSGKLAMKKSKANIYESIMYVAESLTVTAAEKGISIVVDCSDNLPFVYTNTDRAEQVLVCLVDNAIKHSETDKIEISANQSKEKIIISVTNDGSIAETDIEHLFDRFYKADKSHSSEGAGLGLSISSEILSMLGEKIWVTSENGRVTFSFTLQLYNDLSNEN